MKDRYLKIVKISLVLISVFSLVLVGYFLGSKLIYAQADYDDRSLELVNSVRRDNKLNPLEWNTKLAESAQDKLNDILENGYFQHTSPSGVKAWDFILKNDYPYIYAGENLAIDYTSVDDAFDAWMNSPTHLANILSNKYQEYGFAQGEGYIEGHKSKVYVQIFATRENLIDNLISIK